MSPEEGSPAEDSGGSGGTTTPPGSAPSGEGEPSPEPTAGSGSGNPGSDPTAGLLPEDELDRLFPNLPPDPGEEGKRTLEGIDADGDGVRDDVQRAIYRLEPRDERKRRAMLQYARGLQRMMLARNDLNAFLKASRQSIIDIQCIREVIGWFSDSGPEKAREDRIIRETIEYLFYNTEARVLADFEANAQVPSGAYPLTVSAEQTTGFCE
ncbi:MAG: hypothetical protein SNJ68_09160 [Cyanobacteriota bacterium]